jgi:hypothetical protein
MELQIEEEIFCSLHDKVRLATCGRVLGLVTHAIDLLWRVLQI